MLKNIKEGIYRGIGLLIVLGTAVFAYSVTGTIKTWSSGETLTATDLNTTVQSLKTAVESATQLVEIHSIQGKIGDAVTLGNGFLYGGLTGNLRLPARYTTTMTRQGIVRSASVTIRGSMGVSASQSCSITLQKNDVDTSISFSILGTTSSGVLSDSDTVSYQTGDTLNWVIACGPFINYESTMDLPIVLKFEF